MSALHVRADGSREPQPGTLDFYAAKYKAHLRLRVASGDYAPRRLPETLRYVDNFLAFIFNEEGSEPVRLGSLPLASAKQIHLTTWLLAHYDRWRKGSTRADALGSVLGCFNWCEDNKVIEASPFRRPKNLRCPRTHHRAMRTHHFRAIYWTAQKDPHSRDFRNIFWAAFWAGVRLIEFRQLEPHELDFNELCGRIPPEKHKTGRKTGTERPFGIGPRLARLLWKLCQDRRADRKKYVFLKNGKPWTKDSLGRAYAKYRSAAGVPPAIKMCAVRHGYAFRLIQAGGSPKEAADQLGNSVRMIEDIYAEEIRYDATHVRQIAAKAERPKKREKPATASPQVAQERRQKREKADCPLFDGLE